jgi:hypothetical protein
MTISWGFYYYYYYYYFTLLCMLNFKQQFFPSIFLKSWSTVHYSYHNHCFKTHPVKLAQGYNWVGCKKKVQIIIDHSRSGQKLGYNSLTIFYNKNNVILIYKKNEGRPRMTWWPKPRVDPGWPSDPSLGPSQPPGQVYNWHADWSKKKLEQVVVGLTFFKIKIIISYLFL